MEIIEDQLLDQVSRKAKENQRLRMNYNFHTSPEAGAQRLVKCSGTRNRTTDTPAYTYGRNLFSNKRQNQSTPL